MFDSNDDPRAVSDQPEAERPTVPPAVERFNTCRWKSTEGRFCSHRDVLPLSGKDGFNPEAWCPDCAFFKVRRTPRKREPNGFGY